MNTVISVKIDKDIKASAQEVANSAGLTLSTLVNAYLRQVAATRRIELYAPEQMTPRLEKPEKVTAMTIRYLPKFKKQYKKLPLKLQLQFDERVRLFVADPTLPMLKVHPLKGEYKGYWSMSVSGDIRALYIMDGDTIVIFALIGSHSQLYG
jgi:addiction module RelE/StbE family toxin